MQGLKVLVVMPDAMVVLGVVELVVNRCFQRKGLDAVVKYRNLVLFRPNQG